MSVLLALTLFTLAFVFSPFQSARAQTADLILSEYVDGSISNQAIEIYNGTGAPVNLNNYRIELYSNTNTTPNATVTLSGSLANDATWVMVNPGAGPQLTGRADQLSNVISFNGNDSVVLRRNGAVIDSFGRIGENPPNGWQGGGVRTFEVTLRRKANICAGRTNPNTSFNPSLGWDQFPQDAFDGLGAHTNNCNVHAPAPLINEFVFNHVGQNTHEYIEIYGQGNANYNAFTVLVIDGRASGNPGQVYRAYPMGMTTTDGYWTTGFMADQIHNGTTTLLLARNFSSGVGIDLDQNNDGFFDFEPWSDLADSIAVSANQQGDRVYSDVTLYSGFGGNAQMVGGASRIPNATNSGSPNDWRRNHFNGEGLNCASCNGNASGNEAVNTPNFANRLGAVMPTPTHVYPSVTPHPTTPYPTTTVYPTVTTGPVTPIPPVPGNCVNLIRNYSFESNNYWIFGQDPVPARYVGEQHQSGLRSLLLGNPPGNGSQNLESFSSVRQLVTVPADGITAYLRWWHIHHTQEGVTDSPGRQEDRQDVILLAQNMQPMDISSRVRQNNGVWQESQVDLTNFIGKTFYIYFNAYNDGNGQRTWQYLDHVQMLVCYPDGYTPMPATPVPPVQPTAPTYPTAYPTACSVSTPCPASTDANGIEVITPSPGATVTDTELVIGGTPSPIATPVPGAGDAPAAADPIIQPTPANPGNSPAVATQTVDHWPTAAPPATDTPSAPASTAPPSATVQLASTPLPADETSDDIASGDPETPTAAAETASTPTIASASVSTPNAAADETTSTVAECVDDLVINPGFEETDDSWRLVANDGQVTYAGEIVASGKQSMRIGMTSATEQAYESYITQVVDLPDAYGSILLTYNYYPMTNATDATSDMQAVDVYNDLTGQLARRVMHVQQNDRDWLYVEDDLSSLAGQKIQLRFAVVDSGGNSTAMYVDNVLIKICDPLPPRTDVDEDQNSGDGNNGDGDSAQNRRWFFGSRVSDADATPPPTSGGSSSSNGFFDSMGSVAVMIGILLIIAIVIWALFFRPRRKSP